MAIFKIIKAEFVKVLKKPMIYIMAFIIVAGIFGAYYLYEPKSFEDNTVSYNNTADINTYYNTFMSDSADSKAVFDTDINKAYNKYYYYLAQNARRTKLNELYDSIVDKYNILESEVNSSEGGPIVREAAFFNLKTALLNYQKMYLEFSNEFYSFANYPFVTTLTSTDEYISGKEPLDTLINEYFASVNNANYSEDSARNVCNAFTATKYLDKINTINTNAINFITYTLQKYYERIENAFENLKIEVNKGSGTYSPATATNYYKAYVKTVDDYKDLFDEMVTNSYYPIILLSDEIFDKTYKISLLGLNAEIGEVDAKINSSQDQQNAYKKMCENIQTAKYFDNIKEFHENATQIYITLNSLEKIEKAIDYTESNQTELLANINEAVSDTAFKELESNVTSYKLLSSTINTYIDNYVVYEVAIHQNYIDIDSLYGECFDNYNQYRINESIALNYYYLQSNTYANSYTNNLSLLNSSSNESNMFDFMYYAMEICSVIIMIFSMVLCASLITQEIESGTIKLLLVRPYKRSTILTAKMFTTLIFSALFILFSGIISAVAGFVYFGYVSQNILLVLDATTVISLSPIVVIIIDLISIFIDVSFFVLIALFFSVMSKNFASTICFCASSVILMLVLNLFFGTAFWYSFLPFMNIHLFKYFGNSFIVGSDSIVRKLLITGIASSMNLMYSLLILVAYIIIFLAISYTIFNKRDF